MKTNVLMIYPEMPNTYWSFKYTLPFIGKKASLPPLGLMTIAALLPDRYAIKLVDMNVTDLCTADIKVADLIFISSMIIQKNSMEDVIKQCKMLNKKIVAGGPYPTSSYLKIEGVDHFVLNEAEVTLPKFIEEYERGCPKSVYWDEQKPDISRIPPPRFDLIDVKAYSNLALQFSRGCPFNCEFCDIIELFGRTPRTKSPEQFIREMECVYETGFRGALFIVDDNFVGHKQKVKELLARIIEWQAAKGYPFSLFSEASIDCARDDEILSLMVRAGFDMLFLGIETPHRETLKMVNKTQNLKTDIYQDVEKIQRSGIEVSGGFIVGFDSDPDDIFDLQIDSIQKLGIPLAMVGLLSVLPNTQLYRRLQKENRLTSDPSGNNTHDLRLTFEPRMPKQMLLEGYKRVISTIYSPKNYFERCLTLLKRMPPKKKVYRPIEIGGVKALFGSLWKQTFSSYGIVYLTFLGKSLFFNYRLFSEAIAMAVKGYHLFKTTEEILKADAFSTMLETSLNALQGQMKEMFVQLNTQLSVEIEGCKSHVKNQMQKKYDHLSQEMKNYLEEAYANFEASCENIIAQSKQKLYHGK